VRTAGKGFSSAGISASLQHSLPAKSQVRVSFASGNTLVLGPSSQPVGLTSLLNSAHTRRAQAYSISLSGTLDGTGTRWRATYRWQPESAVTNVASFAENAAEPYLNLHLRQPLYLHRDAPVVSKPCSTFAICWLQGYQPYLLTMGRCWFLRRRSAV